MPCGDFNTGAFQMNEVVPVRATLVTGCTAVALGGGFTCVVVTDGSVECWGDDSSGQLGNGTQSATPNPNPTKVAGLTGVTQLAAGPGRVCALGTSGPAPTPT